MTERLACLIFLLTSHDGLTVAVVDSGERFLAGDVTHIVNCKR